MKRKVIVAQSGGPSHVINFSLYGVVRGYMDYPDKFGYIYAAWHGVEGILKEKLINVSAQKDEEIDLLKSTPAAGVLQRGTSLYASKVDIEEPSADRLDVSDDFVNYAMPLIGDGNSDIKIENGLQRFSKFEMNFIDKVLEEYVPVRNRS